MKPIYYVSAPCGAGKTTAAASYIREHKHNKNFLIVVPTLRLTKSWRESLRLLGVESDRITSDKHDRVAHRVMERLYALSLQDNVLIITWQAYTRLSPDLLREKNVEVLIDELPDVDDFFDWNVSRHVDDLRGFLESGGPINDRVASVVAKDPDRLERELLKDGDDVDKLFAEFKRHLISPNRTVFVDAAAYERVFHLNDISSNQKLNRVSFISMLSPRLFAGATLLAANVKSSLLYHWMTGFHGVRFKQRVEIAMRMKPQFPKKQWLRLHYFLEGDARASQEKLKLPTPTGGLLHDEIDQQVSKLFGSAEFIHVANKGREPEIFDAENVKSMKVDSRGLNSYRRFHKIYVDFVLNPTPAHIKMLNNLGMTSQQIYESKTCEKAYQAALRTSLRHHKPDEIVDVAVLDLTTANYIAGAVGGAASITKLPCSYVHVPKSKPLNPLEKKRKHRAKKALDEFAASKGEPLPSKGLSGRFDVGNLDPLPQGREWLASLADSESESDSEVESEKGRLPACYVTLHGSYFDNCEDDHTMITTDPVTFVDFLRIRSKNPLDKKEGRCLYNSGVYATDDSGSGWRTVANFQKSSMLVLDFDNGNISPEQFVDIFGPRVSSGRRLNFAIYNSFSRSPEEPNRFHVVVFFREPASSIKEHQAVYHGIVRRLEEAGFNEAGMRLDDRCHTGVQSFYLPCTNRAHPEMAFCCAHGVNERDLKRALVPAQFSKTQQPTGTRHQSKRASMLPLAGDVEAILEPYRGKPRESRSKPIFHVCRKLVRLGLSDGEIEALVYEVFGSEPKVRKKLKNDVKRARQYYSQRRDADSGSASTSL